MDKFYLMDDLRDVQCVKNEDFPYLAGALMQPFFLECQTLYYDDVNHHAQRQDSDLDPFFSFQTLILFLLASDHYMNFFERKVYKEICASLGFEPLTQKLALNTLARLHDHPGDVYRYSSWFRQSREVLPADQNYHHFLLGLWCIGFSDNALHKSEYDFIASLYDKTKDEMPSSFSMAKVVLGRA
jgi:hypothetical protein